MKKFSFRSFVLGALAAALILTVAAPALAEPIEAAFNSINIYVNGARVAAKGEMFVTGGNAVPFSINYQGTTYLPMKKLAQILGKEVSWDAETGTARIDEAGAEPSPSPSPSPQGNVIYDWQGNVVPPEKYNPLLFGKNVQFSESWLKLINGRDITNEKMELERDYTDRLYTAMKDFFNGKAPMDGKRIFLESIINDGGIGHAACWLGSNYIRFHDDFAERKLRDLVSKDGTSDTEAHEMAHLFLSMSENMINTIPEHESFADFLALYAHEKTGIKVLDTSVSDFPVNAKEIISKDKENFRKFSIDNLLNEAPKYLSNYLNYELVDIVGWDVYKTVLNGYADDKNPRANNVNANSSFEKKMLEFLARIGEEYGDMSIVRQLPDNGAVYDMLVARVNAEK
ncbi:MAG: copper amine oxidase N-terminal domain-containing protein [Oscillospiraceae bacterium]|jgi:hypothetical protein|nr:copper amine oxidase N-terminal domain-containing protein [Oscillospiraceae bacterium]